jgi:transcriptional regulator with XRE-family HTH domain
MLVTDTVRVLRMWREIAGLNQKELADLAGIHHTTISAYETGNVVPQAETVARVTAALGMTPADREAAEIYVHQIMSRLRATQVDQASPLPLDIESRISAWRQEGTELGQDGSRFVFRFLHLTFDLLIHIAGAVMKRSDSTDVQPPS